MPPNAAVAMDIQGMIRSGNTTRFTKAALSTISMGARPIGSENRLKAIIPA